MSEISIAYTPIELSLRRHTESEDGVDTSLCQLIVGPIMSKTRPTTLFSAVLPLSWTDAEVQAYLMAEFVYRISMVGTQEFGGF